MDHTGDNWEDNTVCNNSVGLILFDNLKANAVAVIFMSCFDDENTALGAAKIEG